MKERGTGEARRLGSDWQRRGWLVKDATAGNKRRITPELAEIARKLESLKSLKSGGDGLKTDVQADVDEVQA